jgi:limonene-1,2-epoxide hydrolase
VPDNEAIIRAFCAEWDVESPDAAALAAYFTDDAVYHNIPVQPVNGREAIEKTLAGMSGAFHSKGWEVLAIASSGNIVFTERVDRFDVGGKPVVLPVAGVFELRDGKIAAWRDYFDMATWQQQTR